MNDQELERVKNAVGTGEVLKVVYHGGSQPGTIREIVPVSISGDTVWAICLESNRRKQFILSKIEFPGEGGASMRYEFTSTPQWEDFTAFMADMCERYATRGYTLKGMLDGNGELVGVGVHEFTQAGKPRVHPTWKLEYLTTRREFEIDAQGREVVTIKPRAKCWVLSERGKRPQSYGTLAAASRELVIRTIGFV